jgi:hypothetical protein
VRALRADVSGLFFGRGRIVDVVPYTGRDRPIEGERHDQDQAGETVGMAQMGLFEAEPRDLKSENSA